MMNNNNVELQLRGRRSFDENPTNFSNSENLPEKTISSSLLANESSIPAISKVREANTKSRKCFWMFILLVTFSLCTFEAHKFFSVYFEYPVLIDLDIESNPDKVFPAVTICNLNRMKSTYSECKNKAWKKCIEDKFLSVSNIIATTYVRAFSETNLYDTWSSNTPFFDEEYRRNAQSFLSDYAKLDKISRRCYGHLFHEFINTCTFQSKSCRDNDFSFHQSLQFGNCYTFKGQSWKTKDVLRSGLEIELNIEEQQYISLTKSSGIRLVVHNPNELPHPEENGINVSPDFETHVAVTKISHKRLPKPYRDGCREYDSDKNRALEKSQYECILSCMHRHSLSMCCCVDPLLPHEGMRACDLKSEIDMKCLRKVLDALSDRNLSCDCPMPCISSSYNLLISSSALPSDVGNNRNSKLGTLEPECMYEFDFFNNKIIYGDGSENNVSYSYDFPKVIFNYRKRKFVNTTKSRLKIKIYFSSLDHAIYSQKATYSAFEFFAHLGGNINLWLGLSIATIFEIAGNVLTVICCYLHK